MDVPPTDKALEAQQISSPETSPGHIEKDIEIDPSRTTTCAIDEKAAAAKGDSSDADAVEAVTPPDDDGETAARVSTNRSTASTNPAMSLGREIAFVALICMAQLLTQAGLGQAIAPLHYIGESFGNPSPGQLSWFPAAFSLTTGTFIVIAGRVGDIIGHKTLFVGGFAWYSLWSLVAGLSVYSRSQIFFDFCRAMQGIGTAVLLPCALALLGRTYPPGPRKGMVFSLFGATAPNGFLLGALFASLMAELVWWPWAYWLMAIVCAICTVAAVFIIPEPTDDGSSHGPQSFDYLGAVLGVAGLVLFNVAWNQAPVVGWQTPYVIVLLILGMLFFAAFLVVELRVAQPLLPLRGLSPQVGFVLGCVGLGWASFGIFLFYQWQFSGELRGYLPLSIVAQLSPAGPSGICASITTGFLSQRVSPGYLMMIAMFAFCLGNILLATAPVAQTYWANTFVANLLTPWGMDVSFPAASLLLSNFVPKRHQGIAASLVVTVVNYSISFGLGIGGTVESYVNDGGRELLRGFRGAWYAAIGLAGCGMLLSIYFVIHGHLEARTEKKAREESEEQEQEQEQDQ